MHDVAELESTASVNFIHGSGHEHRVEPADGSLRFELSGGPFELANLLQVEEMKVLKGGSLDSLPYSFIIELLLKGEEESKLDESVMIKVRHDVQKSSGQLFFGSRLGEE